MSCFWILFYNFLLIFGVTILLIRGGNSHTNESKYAGVSKTRKYGVKNTFYTEFTFNYKNT